MWVRSLGREDLLEEEMATHSVLLPGESHGQRGLAGDRRWGHRESGTRLNRLGACTASWLSLNLKAGAPSPAPVSPAPKPTLPSSREPLKGSS